MGFVEYQGPLFARLRGASNSQPGEGYNTNIKQTRQYVNKRNRSDYRDRMPMRKLRGTTTHVSTATSNTVVNYHSNKNRY